MNPRRSIVLVLAAASVGLAACGGTGSSPSGPAGTATAAAAVPSFTLQDLQGNTIRLADSAGTIRLVDFWATWCAPCREEIPMFRELNTSYGGKGFTLLTVAMDDPRDPIAPFVKENGINYPVLLGTEEAQDAFGGVVGYPTKFILDRDGKVVVRWIGPVPRRVLEGKIRELLGA